jgi:putative protein kinase ArgK-like GTPase of G3E family
MDDIDKLLSNLDQSSPPAKVPTTKADGVFPQQSGGLDPLLAQMKAEYETTTQAEAIKQREEQQQRQRQQELQQQQKQQRQQELRDRQRQELRRTAELWLKNLKPKTEEAQWFEEFACNYESRLEAAIEYLMALQEVDKTVPRV